MRPPPDRVRRASRPRCASTRSRVAGQPREPSSGSSSTGTLATPPATTTTSLRAAATQTSGTRRRAACRGLVGGRGGRGRQPDGRHDLARPEVSSDRSCSSAAGTGRPAGGRAPRRARRRRPRGRPQGRREVGRVGRDAIAGLQVVLAVVADLGEAGVAAAEPAVPLVPAEVPAARALAEVAADRALVEDRRGGGGGCGPHGATARAFVGRPRRASSCRRCGRRRGRRDAVQAAAWRSTDVRRGDAAVQLTGQVGAAADGAGAGLAQQLQRLPQAAGRSSSCEQLDHSGRRQRQSPGRRPVACRKAFAIAAAVGMIGGSPRPLSRAGA